MESRKYFFGEGGKDENIILIYRINVFLSVKSLICFYLSLRHGYAVPPLSSERGMLAHLLKFKNTNQADRRLK